jgi:hypothetical protein
MRAMIAIICIQVSLRVNILPKPLQRGSGGGGPGEEVKVEDEDGRLPSARYGKLNLIVNDKT